MRRHSLNLDTHYNMFRGRYSSITLAQLSDDLGIVTSIANPLYHLLFDQQGWLLMPEDCILEKYRASLEIFAGISIARRERFHDFPVRLFYHDPIFLSF